MCGRWQCLTGICGRWKWPTSTSGRRQWPGTICLTIAYYCSTIFISSATRVCVYIRVLVWCRRVNCYCRSSISWCRADNSWKQSLCVWCYMITVLHYFEIKEQSEAVASTKRPLQFTDLPYELYLLVKNTFHRAYLVIKHICIEGYIMLSASCCCSNIQLARKNLHFGFNCWPAQKFPTCGVPNMCLFSQHFLFILFSQITTSCDQDFTVLTRTCWRWQRPGTIWLTIADNCSTIIIAIITYIGIGVRVLVWCSCVNCYCVGSTIRCGTHNSWKQPLYVWYYIRIVSGCLILKSKVGFTIKCRKSGATPKKLHGVGGAWGSFPWFF